MFGKGLCVSACIIMRDEAANIAGCLQSLQGNVDEIIVVDTGSQDDSVEIARRFTNQIFFYEWDNDFSKAKNFALSQASGDWIIFLDADEYFVAETGRNLRAIAMDCDSKFDALQIYRQNIDRDKQDMLMDASYVLRFFRHAPMLRYAERIHESVQFLDGRPVRSANVNKEALLLYHTGYSTEIVRKKCARNLAVLQAEIEENPDKKLRFRYLSDSYYGLQDYEQAAKYARMEIDLHEPPEIQPSRPYHTLYDSLRELGAPYAERKAALELGLRDFPERPDFWAEYGAVLYSEGKLNRALKYFCKAEKLHAVYDDSCDFSLLTNSLPTMYSLMAGIYKKRGDQHHAKEYERKSRRGSSKK